MFDMLSLLENVTGGCHGLNRPAGAIPTRQPNDLPSSRAASASLHSPLAVCYFTGVSVMSLDRGKGSC